MKSILRLFFSALFLFSCKSHESYDLIKIQGQTFGTNYSILYSSRAGIEISKQQVDSIFNVIDRSMSTYKDNSLISRWNRNEAIELDEHFIKVFDRSKFIYKKTEGAFDPSIGIMVNAWSFGPEKKNNIPDSTEIKQMMKSVGMNKLTRSNRSINKKNEHTYLDFSAIAKGYAVDLVSNFMQQKRVENYLVEIGGEIRIAGKNTERNTLWKVGVEYPNFDGSQSIIKTIDLRRGAMATSGTYRKYKIDENGHRYAHIIDPKTGHSSMTNLLSVSVITEDCMTADAYATAFKTMGIKKIKSFLQANTDIKVFLIYESDSNELQTLSLNGFPDD